MDDFWYSHYQGLVPFFHFEAHNDNVNSPDLCWSTCRVSEGGMSHSHFIGQEMLMLCHLISFIRAFIAEITKNALV